MLNAHQTLLAESAEHTEKIKRFVSIMTMPQENLEVGCVTTVTAASDGLVTVSNAYALPLITS